LTDSAKNSNSLESLFDLAYNAGHALPLAAYVGMDTDRPIVWRWSAIPFIAERAIIWLPRSSMPTTAPIFTRLGAQN
jgi:hypothetical protein